MSTTDIYNYRKVNDRISTGGQPTEEQLRSAAAEDLPRYQPRLIDSDRALSERRRAGSLAGRGTTTSR
jgi:hypothetical protein